MVVLPMRILPLPRLSSRDSHSCAACLSHNTRRVVLEVFARKSQDCLFAQSVKKATADWFIQRLDGMRERQERRTDMRRHSRGGWRASLGWWTSGFAAWRASKSCPLIPARCRGQSLSSRQQAASKPNAGPQAFSLLGVWTTAAQVMRSGSARPRF